MSLKQCLPYLPILLVKKSQGCVNDLEKKHFWSARVVDETQLRFFRLAVQQAEAFRSCHVLPSLFGGSLTGWPFQKSRMNFLLKWWKNQKKNLQDEKSNMNCKKLDPTSELRFSMLTFQWSFGSINSTEAAYNLEVGQPMFFTWLEATKFSQELVV